MWLDRCLPEHGQEWNEIRLKTWLQLQSHQMLDWFCHLPFLHDIYERKVTIRFYPFLLFFSQYPQILRLQLFSAANVANQKPGLCREQYSHCSRQPGPPATLAEVRILLEEIMIPARQWYSPSPFSSDLGVWEIKPNGLTTEEQTKWKVNHTLLLVLCLSPNRPRVMAWLLFITEAQKASPLKLSLSLQAWMLEKGLSNRNQNTCSRGQWESMNSLTAPLLQPLPKVKLHFQESLINLHILIEGLFYHSWTAA